jgi:hypothetical protein
MLFARHKDGHRIPVLGQLEGIGNFCSVSWWGARVPARALVRGTLLHAGDSLETLLTRIDPAIEPEGSR